MLDALAGSDLKVSFKKGDRVVRRDRPLLPPLVVDHQRTHFCGEPDPNGPVFCIDEGARRGIMPRAFDQCNLVHCPPGYEPAPSSQEPLRTLFWAKRNWELLVSLHSHVTMARTVRHVRKRFRRDERIAAALAEEPGAHAMRRAALAMGEIAR